MRILRRYFRFLNACFDHRLFRHDVHTSKSLTRPWGTADFGIMNPEQSEEVEKKPEQGKEAAQKLEAAI